MSWHEDTAEYAEELTEVFAYPNVSYEDPDCEKDTVTASVGKRRRERRYDDKGMFLVQTIPIITNNSEVTIRIDGTFTVDGQQYKVEQTEPSIGGRTKSTCVAWSSRENSRRKFRG